MVLGPNQEKWVAALESGQYKQVKGCLSSDHGYCCLGVACEILEIPKTRGDYHTYFTYDGDTAVLPDSAKQLLAMRTDNGAINGDAFSLVALNDIGKTFSEIAQVIRDSADELFSEPR